MTDRMKSEAIRTPLREYNILAEIRCYQEKWRQNVRGCPRIYFNGVTLPISRWEKET
jgi:hypothetical protein